MRKLNALHMVIAGLLTVSLFAATMIGTAHARMGDDCNYSRGPHHGPFSGPMAKRLGLTDDQRKQIASIMEAQSDDAHATMKQLRTLHQQLHDAATTVPFDAAHVKQLADQQAGIISTLTVKRMTTFSQAYALLTDDQKKKLADMKAKHAGWSHDGSDDQAN